MFRTLIHWYCVLSLVLGQAQFRLAFAELTFDQKKDNALKAQAVLAGCKRDPKDQRHVLDQVKAGMISEVESGAPSSCVQNGLISQFVKDVQKVKAATEKQSEATSEQNSLRFGQSLRMQTLKNAMMTYFDSELRYNLDAPNPQALHKPQTLAEMFYGKKWSELQKENDAAGLKDLQELENVVNDYQSAFHQNKLKTYSLTEAKTALNEHLNVLRSAYGKIDPEIAKAKTEAQNVSIFPKSRPDGLYATDGIRKAGAAANQNIQISNFKATVEPLQIKKKAFYDQFMQDSQEGVGLLLYTKALREDAGVIQDQTVNGTDVIKKAIGEIKDSTLDLARKTNEQFGSLKYLLSPAGKAQANVASVGSNMVAGLAPAFQAPTNFRDSLKAMLKTNPVAAGQILAEHPEFATEVCTVSNEIAADDAQDRMLKKGLDDLTWGVTIVGGVLLATGVLSVAGVAMEGVAAGITTLEAVNVGLYSASVIGNVGYTTKRHFDLKEDMSNNQDAILAKTGGQLKQLTTDENEIKKTGVLEVTKDIAVASLPYGAGKLGKYMRNTAALAKVEKNAATIDQVSEVKTPDPVPPPPVEKTPEILPIEVKVPEVATAAPVNQTAPSNLTAGTMTKAEREAMRKAKRQRPEQMTEVEPAKTQKTKSELPKKDLPDVAAVVLKQESKSITKTIEMEKGAEKQLNKLPKDVQEKYTQWQKEVEKDGLGKTREKPAYHDELLKRCKDFNIRSVRVTLKYRLIYKISESAQSKSVNIIDFNDHNKMNYGKEYGCY